MLPYFERTRSTSVSHPSPKTLYSTTTPSNSSSYGLGGSTPLTPRDRSTASVSSSASSASPASPANSLSRPPISPHAALASAEKVTFLRVNVV